MLSEWCIRRPVTTVMTLCGALVFGAVALTRIPLMAFPEMAWPGMRVSVLYPSSSPFEVEREITIPLEDELSTLQRLKRISSTSSSEGSSIRLEFEVGTDMELMAVEVRERAERARPNLPEDAERMRVRGWRSSDRPIVRMSVGWDGPTSELYDLVENQIKPRIERIEGVAQVEIRGIDRRQVLVRLDGAALGTYGLDPQDVTTKLVQGARNVPAGTVEFDGREYAVRAIGEFESVDEIRNLPLGGGGLVLTHVADVSVGAPEKKEYSRLNERDAVSVRVFKSSTANVVEVADRVRAAMDAVRAERGADRLDIQVYRDQSEAIRKSLSNLRNAGIVGAILAIGMIFAFLRRMRSTLVIAVAIPASLVTAITVMFVARQLGSSITLNVVSMMGLVLAVGMLVDNAVVVLESIFRQRERGVAPVEAAVVGAREVSTAVIAATATTVCVFVPMVLMTDSPFGMWMKDFGLSICAAMGASLFIALTLVPLLSSRLFTAAERTEGARFTRVLEERYARLIEWTLGHRWIMMASVGGALGACAFLYTLIDKEMMPWSPEREVHVQVEMPQNYSLAEAKALFDRTERMLMNHRKELELETLSSRFEAKRGTLRLFLTDAEEQTASTVEIERRVKKLFPEVAGVEWKMGRRRHGGGAEMGVTVDLKGEESGVLEILAEEVRRRMGAIEGLRDVETSLTSGDEEIHAAIHREKAARHGLSTRRVAMTAQAALSARPVGEFRTRDEELDITVQLREKDRASTAQLETLPVRNEWGDLAPFGVLASLSRQKGPSETKREDRRAIVTVEANTERRGLLKIGETIQEALSGLSLPLGYTWQMGQQFRRMQESTRSAGFVLWFSLALIYIIMAALFESFVQPLTILCSVPFALLGVLAIFSASGQTLSSVAVLGVLILCGIVVNNGIVLIDYIIRLRGRGLSRREAIIEGGRARLRPILMTAATTILGLTPMVAPIIAPSWFGPLEGSAAWWAPVGLAVAAGLTTSTFMTLIVVPTLYTLFDDLAGFLVGAIRLARR